MSDTPSLSWNDTWAYLKVSDEEIMKDFFSQIDIIHVLKPLTSKYQIEILENAPRWVHKFAESVLLPKTKEFLELGEEKLVITEPEPSTRIFRIEIV